jgi:hypothetical protein
MTPECISQALIFGGHLNPSIFLAYDVADIRAEDDSKAVCRGREAAALATQLCTRSASDVFAVCSPLCFSNAVHKSITSLLPFISMLHWACGKHCANV